MKTLAISFKALRGCGLALIVLFALANQATAQSCIIPPAGLVSWWPAEGNADDLQDGNHGTVQNGATFASGEVGQAFSFDDATGSNVRVPGSLSLQPPTITLGAWIKPTAVTDWHKMISKDFHGNGDWVGPFASYILELSGLTPLAEFNIDGNLFPCSSDVDVPPNAFSHVAATYDGTNVKIYVNGVLRNTCFQPGTLTYGAMTDLALGSRSPYTPGEGVTGLLDEAEIYNRALSAAEIAAIFNAGSAGKCKWVLFAAFAPTLKSTLGPLANDDVLDVKATFTLGAGSDGINPVAEDVTIQVGSFSRTIPAGSFTLGRTGRFSFSGVIDGVSLKATVTPLGGGSFSFDATGGNAPLDGTVMPVRTRLVIGNDGGSATLTNITAK